MKNPTLLLATLLLFSFVLFHSCNSGSTDNSEAATDNQAEAEAEVHDVGGEAETTTVFGQMFTGSPYNQDGEAGCGDPYNGDWQSYFTYSDTSITMTAGPDCRTVNTKTNSSCVFTVGDDGITEISFDFKISDACHPSTAETDWLSFWMYSEPWSNRVEVDFIESKNGPSKGLNSNFGGAGHQVGIFPGGPTPSWEGSITATFSGTGDSISVQVSNTVNDSIATTILLRDTGYFFVMDTTPTEDEGCTITVSNVTAKGSLSGSGNCAGLTIVTGD